MLGSRKIKFSALFLIVLSLFIISIATIVPLLVSSDAIQIRLTHDLSTWTGYTAQLRERPYISIFPSLKASLTGVTLIDTNNNGLSLMNVEHIEVDLSLYEAVLGKIRFSEIRIINPRFTINSPIQTLSNSEGIFDTVIRKAGKFVKQNSKKPNLQFLDQPFGRILIKEGTLAYRATQKRQEEEITHINAIVDWPQFTRAATLKASGWWHKSLINLTIKTDQALLLMTGKTSSVRVSINANRIGLTFIGKARFSDKFLLDGHIASRFLAWDQSIEWIDSINSFGAYIKEPIVWESFFKAQPDHIEFNDIIFTLGNDNARGALEIAFQDNIPIINGSLAFETLNLNQFFPLFFLNKSIFSDLSSFKRFGLDMRLSTSETSIQSATVNDLAASIQIRNGRLVFDIGNAQIFGGTAQANVQLQHNSQCAILLESRLSARNINLKQLLKTLGKKPILDSNANLTLSLQSTFPQWSDFLQNAYGKLAFDLGQGKLENFDMKALMQQIDAGKTFTVETTNNTSFTFDKVNSKAVIKNEKINFDFITLYFGQQIIDVYGKIDSFKNNLKLIGIIDLPRTIDSICADTQCIDKSLLPIRRFTIKGSWLNPLISPLTG
ncbi:MAG: Uncharacterized protein involved in outer membrane biogenesis [Candidatus Tokpelaia sp. JSC188]|nr:MAG: Uncharacterized protein involved in outer membrane biogenesis [Candidatus Tokpelaia sp. JSC188]